ncbi:hypothetical protein B0O80DRAFT_464955 [Mortierella sp. GBAus27b]|nr:hypothetical protein B0O80DRAFT_464955 [Mortierella sp. GBAus27b]
MGLVLSMQRLHMDGRIELAHTLLNQYRRKLHGLFLQGDSPEEWLPQIRSSFPTRSSFPQLALFGVFYREKRINIPSDCIPWVVDMVSAPVLEPELAQQPTPTQDADAIAEESSCNVMSGSRTMAQPGGMELAHLVHISFAFVALLPQEWRMVIEAIDFSTLQKLSLYFSNMMAEQFKLLVDRVPDNTMDRAPLKNLILRGSYVIEKTDSCTLEAMLALLRAKVPLIEITTT